MFEDIDNLIKDSILNDLEEINKKLKISEVNDNPIDLYNISEKIYNNKYKFDYFLEKLIAKDRSSYPRLIAKSSYEQKIVLKYIHNELLKHYEKSQEIQLETPNKKVKNLYKFLKESNKKYLLYKLDIKNFYPSINREILYQKLKDAKVSYQIQLLIKDTCNTVNKPKKNSDPSKYPNTKGVHQGISISNILTEIYLMDFDNEIRNLVSYYDRYVDDIIVIVENNTNNIIELIKDRIKSLNLELNDGKQDKIDYDPINKTITSQKNTDTKFLFLGYTFLFKNFPNKENSLTISIEEEKVLNKLTKICKSFHFFNKFLANYEKKEAHTDSNTDNYSKTLEEYKKAATLEIQREIYGMIFNKKIYGWLNYYTTVNDDEIFGRMYGVIKQQCEKYNRFFNINDFISLYNAKMDILQKKLDYFPSFLEIEEKSLIIRILEINNIKPHKKSTEEEIYNLYRKLIIKKFKYIKLQLKHDTYIVK